MWLNLSHGDRIYLFTLMVPWALCHVWSLGQHVRHQNEVIYLIYFKISKSSFTDEIDDLACLKVRSEVGFSHPLK